MQKYSPPQNTSGKAMRHSAYQQLSVSCPLALLQQGAEVGNQNYQCAANFRNANMAHRCSLLYLNLWLEK